MSNICKNCNIRGGTRTLLMIYNLSVKQAQIQRSYNKVLNVFSKRQNTKLTPKYWFLKLNNIIL